MSLYRNQYGPWDYIREHTCYSAPSIKDDTLRQAVLGAWSFIHNKDVSMKQACNYYGKTYGVNAKDIYKQLNRIALGRMRRDNG